MRGGGGGGVGNLRLARCQEPCLTSRTQTKQFHFYTYCYCHFTQIIATHVKIFKQQQWYRNFCYSQ